MILSDNEINALCTASHVLTMVKPGVDKPQKQVVEVSSFLTQLQSAKEYYADLYPEYQFQVESKDDFPYSMISDYRDHLVREVDGKKVISFGQSSYGYDVRIAPTFKIFTPVHSGEVDPKGIDDKSFVEVTLGEDDKDYILIPPNSFALAHSVEVIDMPMNVTAIVLGKSTYARAGINCLATPLEAGWRGQITLEYANTTPLPVRLYANEGAAQVIFHKGHDLCKTSYADRNGKYQDQTGITLPRA